MRYLLSGARLRKIPLVNRRVPSWAAALCVAAVLAAGLAVLAAFDPLAYRGRPSAVPVRAPLPPGSYREGPLAPGEEVPPPEAAGWLNGPPPERGGRLTVLDVWAHW